MADPAVSVVIPAFRAEHTIRRAVDSVLAQTVPAREIIVVDDGSPDNLGEVVRQYGPPVILIRQPNCKTAHARNRGIDRARGDFVAFLDADDYWEPDKLELQLATFAAHPELGVVASRYYDQHPDGNRTTRCFGKEDEFDRVRIESGARAFRLGTMLWTGTVMVRRSSLEQERFVPGLEPAEDRDLWIRLCARSPVYVISEPLATAVWEEGGISRTDIARDCTKMLEVIERHRHMLGWVTSLYWQAFVWYRWAAMEPAARAALPRLLWSMWIWPVPLVGMPTMRSFSRIRRLVVLLKELVIDNRRTFVPGSPG